MDSLTFQLGRLQEMANLIIKIRDASKKENGRLTPAGGKFVEFGVAAGLGPSCIAKILDVKPSAISQRMKKLK